MRWSKRAYRRTGGNINREIAKHNHFVRVAKNEIIDMVHKIADRYEALKLPVLLWG